MNELEGRVALVTGASRGIGAQCARALARDGATVALAARSASDLEVIAAELGDRGRPFVCDLSNAEAARSLAGSVREELGRLDILVNNAGMSHTRPVEAFDADDFQAVMDLNVRAVLLLTAAAVDLMKQSGHGGSIVNISTVAAGTGSPYMSFYGASKGAIESFTRAAACELGPAGIRVNGVAPGLIVTDMWERGREIPGLVDRLEGAVALRRWGTPEDVADVVAFLASDRARYVTGQTILVDGGMAHMMELLPRRD